MLSVLGDNDLNNLNKEGCNVKRVVAHHIVESKKVPAAMVEHPVDHRLQPQAARSISREVKRMGSSGWTWSLYQRTQRSSSPAAQRRRMVRDRSLLAKEYWDSGMWVTACCMIVSISFP